MSVNIEEDLKIDLTNLDVMIKDHPSNYFKYYDLYNNEKSELASLELTLEVQEAKTALSIRNGVYPGTSGAKITEGYVKELITADEALTTLKQEINEKKSDVQKLWAVVDAFQHRKYSLIKAVDLWISNYYSDVKPSPEKNFRNRQLDALREEE